MDTGIPRISIRIDGNGQLLVETGPTTEEDQNLKIETVYVREADGNSNFDPQCFADIARDAFVAGGKWARKQPTRQIVVK